MKSVIVIFMLAFFICSTFAQQKDLSGIWLGKLELPNTLELTIVFNISRDSTGKLSTTLDSPDQGAKGIPTGNTMINNDSIIINIPAVMGNYTGKIISEEMKIQGKWNQAGMSLDLTVKKVEKLEEPKRPQEPEEPFPYIAEEVRFENRRDGILLAGTLTLPLEGINFPAVILISGSGGQDRNEEIFKHKPFLVIADYLTKSGIAVLRFDDRGIGESEGDQLAATTEDFVKDVLAAVDYLETRKEIDHSRIGLIGHSEGGLIAPMAAVESGSVSFIVLMAGTGIKGDSLLTLQTELIYRSVGSSEDEIRTMLESQREIFSLVINSESDEILAEKLREISNREFAEMPDEEKGKYGDPETYANMQIRAVITPWFKYFLRYDPVPVLEKVSCPVLAINGEKDLQVPPQENLSAIESALKRGGNRNYEVKMLPGLNHLFQTSSTGAVSEYGQLEETISPLALETMLNWIKKVTN